MIRIEFWLSLLAFLLCSLLLALLAPPWLAAETYTVTVLGPAAPWVANVHPAPLGTEMVTAAAVTDDGIVAGTLVTPRRIRAALLLPTRQVLGEMGTRPEAFVGGIARQADGTLSVVGMAVHDDAEELAYAFRWSEVGGFENISPTFVTGAAHAVTTTGLIAGGTSTGTGEKATLWRDGGPTALPTLGGLTGDLIGVTEQGFLAGRSELPGEDRVTHAAAWLFHTPVDLTPDLAGVSMALAMNDAGVVVGIAEFPTGGHALRWSFLCGASDLGTLPGDGRSVARAVNEAGMIVGQSTGNRPVDVLQLTAWRWTLAEGMGDLTSRVTTPGWEIYDAVAINNAGQILAYGTHDHLDQAVLLTSDTPPLTRHAHQRGRLVQASTPAPAPEDPPVPACPAP